MSRRWRDEEPRRFARARPVLEPARHVNWGGPPTVWVATPAEVARREAMGWRVVMRHGDGALMELER